MEPGIRRHRIAVFFRSGCHLPYTLHYFGVNPGRRERVGQTLLSVLVFGLADAKGDRQECLSYSLHNFSLANYSAANNNDRVGSCSPGAQNNKPTDQIIRWWVRSKRTLKEACVRLTTVPALKKDTRVRPRDNSSNKRHSSQGVRPIS